jgi:transcriptional regulator with PAS, ATPase and Fis domain
VTSEIEGGLKELREKLRLYEVVLHNILSGVLITDPEGKVIFFSDTYGKFLGMDPKSKIGKHCTEVIENTRMHIVAKTGEPEINHPHKIQDKNMVVQRLPIRLDGRLVAVFGQVMFEDVRDVQRLANKLNILESKVRFYEKELENLRSSKYSCNNIIGRSASIIEVRKLALKAARVNAPVLILGESGTGKELFAHAIHRSGDRSQQPFVRLNCAAIPKDLLEAELFGYEPGAFTGAGSKAKLGKFELAHQGSIFLDEISELPLEMQPKLLRVLEEKELERLGGTRVIKCDFRLIAATHEDLEELVKQGRFRADLYYRLNVIPLHLPPLRERQEDIPLIAGHFVQMLNKDFGTNVTKISPEVLGIFQNYHWPGNVRELSNIIERILYSMEGIEDTIKVEHLPILFRSRDRKKAQGTPVRLRDMTMESEREILLQAIRLADNNKNRAAQILGIHRTALYKKLKRHNLPLTPS